MIGKRKLLFEVVPESEYSEQYKEKSSPSNTAIITAATAATASLATLAITKYTNAIIPESVANSTSIPPTIEPLTEPIKVLTQIPPTIPVMGNPEIVPTGFIADTTLAGFATIFDPIIELIVAISLPLTSVVVAAALLMLILGNSEKAQSLIIKAGVGYVLMQMLPALLKILEQMGKAV